MQETSDHLQFYSAPPNMAEKEPDDPRRKHVKQLPSVPFLWEERPGMPKKDWKAEASLPRPLPLPVKLVVSVPFTWEEEPGKPLASFLQPSPESGPSAPYRSHRLLVSPPPLFRVLEIKDTYKGSGEDYSEGDLPDRMDELDLDPFFFDTNDLVSSTPSPLPNWFTTSETISATSPVEMMTSMENSISQMESASSSPARDSESGTSSYTSGKSSLTGASFLEHLFPLLPPKSGFLDRANDQNLDRGGNNSFMLRLPTTLGELIKMSQRRSYKREAVHMRKQKPTMDFAREAAFRCSIFGSGSKMLKGLNSKCQQRLKLV